jgi:hypothetical protein
MFFPRCLKLANTDLIFFHTWRISTIDEKKLKFLIYLDERKDTFRENIDGIVLGLKTPNIIYLSKRLILGACYDLDVLGKES